ncbi:MAG: sulfatase [Deltaproteobacteria bacterium]|nr:sulfatase [Deltaproteobacteria bacterium]
MGSDLLQPCVRMGSGVRRWPSLLALLPLALAACSSEPAERERAPLVSTADGTALTLEGHEIARETRPAIQLEAGTKQNWQARAAGRLRFGFAPGAGAAPDSGIRVTVAGESSEHAVGASASWQTADPKLDVAAGDTIEFATLGPGSVWLADPIVETPRAESTAPLVVVILIDTLRADHTSLDGYALPTSPHLDALAADGVGFLRAYAPAPWTRPSVASLLTSLDPESHRTVRRKDRLASELLTWPEVARAAGYQTVGVSTNPNILHTWGFAQGFARFIDLGAREWLKKGSESDARAVFAQALATLDSEPLPLFLYLHVLDPHHPYTPPLESVRKVYPGFRPREPGQAIAPNAPEAVVRAAVRRYDGEIRHADEALGEFLGELRTRGLYDAAAIVVTGDHGEEFRERGGQYHGHTLYEEQIHVPLVMKHPYQAPAAAPIEHLVSIMDELPTLAEAAGWPLPPEIEGRSLLSTIGGGGPIRDALTASTRLDGAHADALITADRKLIRTLAPDASTRVFDLVGDPGEQAPWYDPELQSRLERTLDHRMATRRTGWHLRVCGGRTTQTVAFAVSGAEGDPRAPSLEPDDSITRVDGALEVRVRAGARKEQRGWEATRAMELVADEDEIVLSGAALTLTPRTGSAPVRFVLGDVERPFDTATALAPDAARRASREAPACELSDAASLLVWYVPEPADTTVVEPDADLRERLQELGYMLDDEPEPAPKN